VFDVTFTARLEEELDEIEDGKLHWREAVKEFWKNLLWISIARATRCCLTKQAYQRQDL